jgi:outer membrane protein assembly factor BamB
VVKSVPYRPVCFVWRISNEIYRRAGGGGGGMKVTLPPTARPAAKACAGFLALNAATGALAWHLPTAKSPLYLATLRVGRNKVTFTGLTLQTSQADPAV